uniref:mediator of RNA polymerase II transcription subunit 28-like isoform X2 n=1 Tax=Styela clava TaxID=7725 RepID=UPI00193A3653|nr:mediator of RNA polymerase II transcription subunit 28-like isoform X2 [Styela clava]
MNSKGIPGISFNIISVFDLQILKFMVALPIDVSLGSYLSRFQMAQPPHYNPQGPPAMSQQGPSLQQMLGSKNLNQGPGGIMMPSYANLPQSTPERTMIDDFEAAFQSCIAPLIPGSDNLGSMPVTPDKLRSSMDHSIQQFTEQARRVEAYFLKKHAMVAQQQPELILQEEIEELKEEIGRREITIRAHMNRVKSWQDNLRNLQNTINDRGPASNSGVNIPQSPATLSQQQPQGGMMHPEMVQQMAGQRR